jgi:hypothetical protein
MIHISFFKLYSMTTMCVRRCASSDLWERLLVHPGVANKGGKETRFFSAGEFAATSPSEGGWMGPNLPLRAFTAHFDDAAARIAERPTEPSVILEGGPHTAWWSNQRPEDGTLGFDVSGRKIQMRLLGLKFF